MNDRITLILTHPRFCSILAQINEIEKNRIYCKHDLTHLLEVARIGYLIALEENLPYERELIYAAALLHDLGRNQTAIDHAQASAYIANEILPQCNFSSAECALISHAISRHRQAADTRDLAYIIYTADKKSRLCFLCTAKETCNWPQEKRNHHLWR